MNDANKDRVNLLDLVQSSGNPSQQVIVISNLGEIHKGIELGYTKKKIFDVLTDAKVITCNYSYFARVLKKYLPAKNHLSDAAEKTSSNLSRSDPPGSFNPFGSDNEPVNPKEFI